MGKNGLKWVWCIEMVSVKRIVLDAFRAYSPLHFGEAIFLKEIIFKAIGGKKK